MTFNEYRAAVIAAHERRTGKPWNADASLTMSQAQFWRMQEQAFSQGQQEPQARDRGSLDWLVDAMRGGR